MQICTCVDAWSMGSAEFTPVNGSRGLATPPSVPKKTSPESGHTPRETTTREEAWTARGVNEPSRLPHFLRWVLSFGSELGPSTGHCKKTSMYHPSRTRK